MGPTKWKGPTLERIRYQPYVAMREWREILARSFGLRRGQEH